MTVDEALEWVGVGVDPENDAQEACGVLAQEVRRLRELNTITERARKKYNLLAINRNRDLVRKTGEYRMLLRQTESDQMECLSITSKLAEAEKDRDKYKLLSENRLDELNRLEKELSSRAGGESA